MFENTTRYATFVDLVHAMNAELDGGVGERSRVLVSFAVLDECIAETLAGFLADCKETGQLLNPKTPGPLGAFTPRVRACVALGLLPRREAKQCLDLAIVRNDFAHEVAPSFVGEVLTLLETSEAASQSEIPKGISPAGGRVPGRGVTEVVKPLASAPLGAP